MTNNKLILKLFILCFIFLEIQCFNQSKYYNKIHTVKLEGNSTLQYYFVNAYFGSPPQRQTLIVDTGSHITAIPCRDCDNCGKNHIDQFYDYKKSITFEEIKCGQHFDNFNCNSCDEQKRCKWNIRYGEGSSYTGYYINDYVILGDEIQKFLDKNDEQNEQVLKYINHEKVRMPFGCINKETNLFVTQKADGILGLAPVTNNTKYLPNLIDEFFYWHKDNDEKSQFSICFHNKQGGILNIGGLNEKIHKKGAKTHTIPYYDHQGYFQIRIFSMKINNVDVNLRANQFSKPIVDSGSTLFLAPSVVIREIQKSFNTHCQQPNRCGLNKIIKVNNPNVSGSNNKCYQRNPETYPELQQFYDAFPILEFQLENDFVFKWKPESYFMQIFQKQGNETLEVYCFGFESYTSDRIILGATWMKNQDILFDRERKEIQFTESECDYSMIENDYMEKQEQFIKTTNQDSSYFNNIENMPTEDVVHYITLGIAAPFMIIGIIQMVRLCKQQINKKHTRLQQLQQESEHEMQKISTKRSGSMDSNEEEYDEECDNQQQQSDLITGEEDKQNIDNNNSQQNFDNDVQIQQENKQEYQQVNSTYAENV